MLRSGSLPVKIEVMENRTVGPTLGQDSKEKSVVAFSIAIIGIFAFMLLFYRIPGVVADIALLLYVMLLLLIMRYLDATLTLPGIAGIILSIAMAIDANVLIFEHFKEEVAAGKTLRSAMDKGFSRAFVTIFDSNITTLIAAVNFVLPRHRPNQRLCRNAGPWRCAEYVYRHYGNQILMNFLLASNLTKKRLPFTELNIPKRRRLNNEISYC
mgnify:CR=1 FL=1